MFAACILFALPTIKEYWIASGTHPVYNSRVHTLGFSLSNLRNLQPRELNTDEQLKYAELLQKKANLEAKFMKEEDQLDIVQTQYKLESAKLMPDTAKQVQMQKQITALRDSMESHRKELTDIRKELEHLRQ